MQKVVTISLNGNAYQMDEVGYHALCDYLARAEASLEKNPDRNEILADLEQALADKCAKFLSPNKTVIATEEIVQVLAEMGPVASDTESESERKKPEEKATGPAPKRLYQIREGAMISGLCNGLAAYFHIDVTIVRIIFVILAFLSHGLWILLYAVTMFIIPYAHTSEDHAAAHGLPFSAQALVAQAKRYYAEFKSDAQWQKHWYRHIRREARQHARQARQWEKMNWQPEREPPLDLHRSYASQVWIGLTIPVISLLSAVFWTASLLALCSLIDTGALFGWPIPHDVPLWAGILILLLAANILHGPIAAAHYTLQRNRHIGFFEHMLWPCLMAVFLTVAYRSVPAVQHVVHQLPEFWQQFRAYVNTHVPGTKI